MQRFLKRLGSLSVAAVLLLSARAPAQDNVEGPWGIANGDIFGRARSDAIPALFDENSVPTEVFRFDARPSGGHRPGGWGSIVFDAAGNLYWRTTLGNNKLISVTPAGRLRWIAKNAGGADYVFGSGWSSASPVIGATRVYAQGAGAYGGGGEPVVAAFNKADGSFVWETLLSGEPPWVDNQQPTPVLYNGKLYVLGQTNGLDARVYQIDAATGAIDWSSPIDLIFPVYGTMALVPNAFGQGQHGLYFNTNSGSGNDGFGEMYGVRIDPDPGAGGASLEWESDGGFTGRSHVIYSPVTDHLYTHTWRDFGATLYVFDPQTGFVGNNGANQPAGGHGFYDTGSLGWDDVTIVAGGFDGRVALYTDNMDGTVGAIAYPYTKWYGEYRTLQQLLKNDDGETIMVSGTNSRCNDLGEDAAVVSLNLDEAVTGPFEDGPMYVDEIEIYDGANLVWSEDFESIPLGVLAGNNGWQHDNAPPSGDDNTNPVLVANDPTGQGHGHVMRLDAAGTNGGWQGAFRNIDPTSGLDTTTIRWKQWRADVTDNNWFYFGDFPNDFDFGAWGIEWDLTEKIYPHMFEDPGGTAAKPLTAGRWQTITITYDHNALLVTVDVDGDTGTGVPNGVLWVEGFGTQLEGTAVSSNGNPTPMEHRTGVCADNGFTIRGGPLTGPDGKIYYFDGATTELVGLCPYHPCDVNCDGAVNASDIESFIDRLFGGGAGCSPCAADANNDGVVNASDIEGFIACLFG